MEYILIIYNGVNPVTKPQDSRDVGQQFKLINYSYNSNMSTYSIVYYNNTASYLLYICFCTLIIIFYSVMQQYLN